MVNLLILTVFILLLRKILLHAKQKIRTCFLEKSKGTEIKYNKYNIIYIFVKDINVFFLILYTKLNDF